MKKTGSQIENDVYQLIKLSPLASAITGKVYRDELRPHGSELEDCVVIFITALDGKNQVGIVNINTYVADKNFGKAFMKDGKRCAEIEALCQAFFDSLPTNHYFFKLANLIQTFDEPEINQHFIHMKLEFKHNTLN